MRNTKKNHYKIQYGNAPIWVILILFIFSQSIEPMYGIALPSIAKSLDVSESTVQFSSSVHFIGFTLGIMTLGRISDIWGRRKVMIFGLTMYSIFTYLGYYIYNIEQLIVLRFLQAYFASVASVVCQAMARDSYSGVALSKLYNNATIFISFAPLIGSLIGGYLIDYLGWRYIFIDLSITSVIILSIIIYVVSETNHNLIHSSQTMYFSVLKKLICDKWVISAAIIIGFYNGILFGLYNEFSFIFITKFGFTSSEYGKLYFTLTIGNIVGGLVAKFLLKKEVSDIKIVNLGLILSFISCLLLFSMSFYIKIYNPIKYISATLILVPVLFHMSGHALAIPIIIRLALKEYNMVNGTAGSIFGSLYYIIVIFISYFVSQIHSDDIVPFFVMTFILNGLSIILFTLNIKSYRQIKLKTK